MAKAKATKKSKGPKFIEFNLKSETFDFTGRIYPENVKKTKKAKIYPFSLCLNDSITIKGMKLWSTKENTFITGPVYFVDKEYKPYLFIDPDFNEEFTGLAEKLLEKLEDEDDESEDD